MSKLIRRSARLLTRGLGVLALALLLTLLGALVAHDARVPQRFVVALLTLAFVGSGTLLVARGVAWLVRRGAVELVIRKLTPPLAPARIAIVAAAPFALLFAYMTLFAASDGLPAALVFLGGLLWLLAGAERKGGRARRLVDAVEQAWARPVEAYALAARLVVAGLAGLVLVVVWLAG